MSLINCEIDLGLGRNILNNWYKTFCCSCNCQLKIKSTLSTQDNAKPLEQLKSGFKRTINWSNYQSKKSSER